MILRDYDQYSKDQLQYKTPTTFRGGSFAEIRYNREPFFIETPRLYCPYGISEQYNTLTLSFTDRDIDFEITKFESLIQTLDKQVQEHLKKETESLQYRPTFRASDKMDVKILDETKGEPTSFFNTEKCKIRAADITGQCYLVMIVQLKGVWMTDEKFGCTWQAVQLQLHPKPNFTRLAIRGPTNILEAYGIQTSRATGPIISKNDGSQAPAPPPPAPPPPPLSSMKEKSRKSIAQIIAENKGKIYRPPPEKDGITVPTLDEILTSLNRLKKVESVLPIEREETHHEKMIAEIKQVLKDKDNDNDKDQ